VLSIDAIVRGRVLKDREMLGVLLLLLGIVVLSGVLLLLHRLTV
jgi:hypothetical protein